MTNKTTQPKGTTKQPKVAPTGAKVKQSTSGNTTVAPKAKSSQKAVQKATGVSPVKVSTTKPTIKGLQAEVASWKQTSERLNDLVNLRDQDVEAWAIQYAKQTARAQLLEQALNSAEAALDVEINKSWWEITKERFVESLYRVFGRFTSYE